MEALITAWKMSHTQESDYAVVLANFEEQLEAIEAAERKALKMVWMAVGGVLFFLMLAFALLMVLRPDVGDIADVMGVGSVGGVGGSGQACNADSDCDSYNCTGGKCYEGVPGDPCEEDSDCSSYNCTGGKCYAGDPGDPCEENSDCGSYKCPKGKCQ